MSKFIEKTKDVVSSRGFITAAFTALLIAVVVFVNVIATLITETFGLYLYAKSDVDLSISGATDEIFEEALLEGQKVTVTFCMEEDDLATYTTGAFVYETAKQYAERYPFIELNYVNLLTKMDKDGNIVDLSKYLKDMRGNELPLRRDSIIFSTGEDERENYRVITDTATSYGFSDFYMLSAAGTPIAYMGDEVFGSMVAWVLHKEHKIAYITEGHGETIDVALGNLLSSAGYYVDVINLKKSEADEKLAADDVGLVIISNPSIDFEIGVAGGGAEVRSELDRLATYLDIGNDGEGGRLLVTIDPYKESLPELEKFLASRGISVSGDEGEYGYSRDILTDSASGVTLDNLSFVANYATGESAALIGSMQEGERVLVSEISRLNIENKGASTVEPLLLSSATSSAIREGKKVADGPFVIAAYSETQEPSGSTSGIIVVPSVLIANGDLMVSSGYANKGFLYGVLHELCGSNVAIYNTDMVKFNTFVVENLTEQTALTMTVILAIIPAAIAVVGAVTIIRRKNR